MIKTLIIPGSIAAVILSMSAFADSPGMGGDKATEGAHSSPGVAEGNREGFPKFDELDENHDGQISEQELNVWGATAAGPGEETTRQMMMDHDEDGDGSLSRKELHKGTMKQMENEY